MYNIEHWPTKGHQKRKLFRERSIRNRILTLADAESFKEDGVPTIVIEDHG